jgi:hypothetical protein
MSEQDRPCVSLETKRQQEYLRELEVVSPRDVKRVRASPPTRKTKPNVAPAPLLKSTTNNAYTPSQTTLVGHSGIRMQIVATLAAPGSSAHLGAQWTWLDYVCDGKGLRESHATGRSTNHFRARPLGRLAGLVLNRTTLWDARLIDPCAMWPHPPWIGNGQQRQVQGMAKPAPAQSAPR